MCAVLNEPSFMENELRPARSALSRSYCDFSVEENSSSSSSSMVGKLSVPSKLQFLVQSVLRLSTSVVRATPMLEAARPWNHGYSRRPQDMAVGRQTMRGDFRSEACILHSSHDKDAG